MLRKIIQSIILIILISSSISIECFFQSTAANRDHFCVIEQKTDVYDFHLGRFQFEPAQNHSTELSTENVFLGAVNGPNCSDILDLSIEQSAGLVNYQCAKLDRSTDSDYGMKCCSFGERFQSQSSRHHANLRLGTKVVKPAKNALLAHCLVQDEHGFEAKQWCSSVTHDLCVDILNTKSVAATRPGHIKGCYHQHFSSLFPLQGGSAAGDNAEWCFEHAVNQTAHFVVCICGKHLCNAQSLAAGYWQVRLDKIRAEHEKQRNIQREIEEQKRQKQQIWILQRRAAEEADRMTKYETLATELKTENTCLKEPCESLTAGVGNFYRSYNLYYSCLCFLIICLSNFLSV